MINNPSQYKNKDSSQILWLILGLSLLLVNIISLLAIKKNKYKYLLAIIINTLLHILNLLLWDYDAMHFLENNNKNYVENKEINLEN